MAFQLLAKDMLEFLNKFYKSLQEMDADFDQQVQAMFSMNSVLYNFEQSLHSCIKSKQETDVKKVFESHI
jgi:hypothetical protein